VIKQHCQLHLQQQLTVNATFPQVVNLAAHHIPCICTFTTYQLLVFATYQLLHDTV